MHGHSLGMGNAQALRCLGPLPERAAKYCERYMKPGRIGRIAVGRVSRDAVNLFGKYVGY